MSIDLAVQEQLDRLGVPYELFPCDPELADTAAFCAAYGFQPEESANTILVIGKSEPPVYVACVVLATTRLDVGRSGSGSARARHRLPRPKKLEPLRAFGGVTVFGLPPDLPIWIDSGVMQRKRVVLGGGSR